MSTKESKSDKPCNIDIVSGSTLPPLKSLTYYPFKDGKNIIDTEGNKYYYHELIKAGYSTMDLHYVKRVYCH